MIQLEIPLFDQLQTAIASPQDAELLELLRLFDATMLELDDLTCLRVAGDALPSAHAKRVRSTGDDF